MDEIEPKFGEWLRGIYASERNPQRDGMYVRTIRRTGRTNPGTYYELTDGKGRVWSYPAQSVERTPKPAPAMPNGVEEARVLVAQAPDRRPRPAAPRGLQVSRACQSYVERSGICADGFIQTRHCRGDFAGCPMCKAPTQTVPNCQLEDVERNPHFNEDGSPRYYKPQGGA